MAEIFVKDEIYKTIQNTHGDVSKFVNNVLNQYLEAFKPDNMDGIDNYTTHGNAD